MGSAGCWRPARGFSSCLRCHGPVARLLPELPSGAYVAADGRDDLCHAVLTLLGQRPPPVPLVIDENPSDRGKETESGCRNIVIVLPSSTFRELSVCRKACQRLDLHRPSAFLQSTRPSEEQKDAVLQICRTFLSAYDVKDLVFLLNPCTDWGAVHALFGAVTTNDELVKRLTSWHPADWPTRLHAALTACELKAVADLVKRTGAVGELENPICHERLRLLRWARQHEDGEAKEIARERGIDSALGCGDALDVATECQRVGRSVWMEADSADSVAAAPVPSPEIRLPSTRTASAGNDEDAGSPRPLQDTGCYTFKKPLCVMLNVTEGRAGSERDVEAVKSLFKDKLRYAFEEITDPDRDSFFAKTDEIQESIESNGHDLFVFVGMSHGDGDHIEVRQGGRVHYRKEVVERFKDDGCLAGCPKVFFFQFCRGVKVEFDAAPGEWIRVKEDVRDLFVCNATYFGYMAARSPSYGSFFIQELCKVLGDAADKDLPLGIEDLVKRAQSSLDEATRPYSMRQTISIDLSTLFRSLFLHRKF